MIINTSDNASIKPYLDKLYIPASDSHKGNNGKVLIIGGSQLFHSASLWAAEVATHFVDMVHYASTLENNAIFQQLKTVFRNGIVVEQKDIPNYVQEDDAVLIGPGMVREEEKSGDINVQEFADLLSLKSESIFSRRLTNYLLKTYPQKRFVIDAGALQMMDADWLKLPSEQVIITPHQLEFERLFGKSVIDLSLEEKVQVVKSYALDYKCVILLKAVDDIISDGETVVVIRGGNQGLTKGGSGDILAGITASLRTKNDALVSAIIASYSEKQASDALKEQKGYWYNMSELIEQIPITFAENFKRI